VINEIVDDHVDLLMSEYRPAAERCDRLAAKLAAATAERNAVLAALSKTGLRQRDICDLTGLTITRLRSALWSEWKADHGQP
jgi:hypothetical protein